MRSWKTPALLATIGLCGLGSLFAQGPALPSLADPTPVNGSSYSTSPLPAVDAPVSDSNDSEVVAPAPITESVEQAAPAPVVESVPVVSDAPSSSGGIEMHSVPATSSDGSATQYVLPPAEPVGVSSSVVAGPEFPPSGCSCQGSSSEYGSPMMSGPAMGGGTYGTHYGFTPPPPAGLIYTMGSGSGVAAGGLTPNSNSGGLHTRYPYYNYRAPWYYQGPPSMNVTIVW